MGQRSSCGACETEIADDPTYDRADSPSAGPRPVAYRSTRWFSRPVNLAGGGAVFSGGVHALSLLPRDGAGKKTLCPPFPCRN